MLTIDLQFVWLCWNLRDSFSKLNDKLRKIISFDATPEVTIIWRKTIELKNNNRSKSNNKYAQKKKKM